MSNVPRAGEAARPAEDGPTPAGAGALRGRLLARLRAEADSVAEAAWQQMRVAEPVYDELGELQVEEVRAGVRRLYQLFVSCLAQGRGLTADELETIRVLGVTRAQQDVALTTVQRGFRVAFEVCYRQLVAAAAAEAEAGAAADVLTTVMGELSTSLMDLGFDTVDAIGAGYRQQAQDRAAHQVRWESAVVESVLEGGHREDELRQLLSQARSDVDVPQAMVVLVPVAAATPAEVLGLSSQLAARLPEALLGHVRTQPRPHAVLLTGGADRQARGPLQRFGQEHEAVLLVTPVAGLAELASTYRDLHASLELLPAVRAGGGVVRAGELGVYQALAELDAAAAAALARRELGALLDRPARQRDPLLALLDALIDGDGSLADAARRLGLHRKGAAYRRGRVAQLTGLNPAVPGDWFRLALAVHLLRLHPEAADADHTGTAAAAPGEVDLDQTLAGLSPDTAARLVRQELAAILELPAEQRDRLVAMLTAMVDGDGTIAEAARTLGLRPGGAAYRNRRITQLTGLNPTVPADWFRLALATRLLRTHPAAVATVNTQG